MTRPHQLTLVNGPIGTYQCDQCGVMLSGLTRRDRINLTTPGIGRCPGTPDGDGPGGCDWDDAA